MNETRFNINIYTKTFEVNNVNLEEHPQNTNDEEILWALTTLIDILFIAYWKKKM